MRCRYDLYGLSVREVCPECGTPIQATLLAVVDPLAAELRPLHRPRLTAAGMLAWTTGALAAALLLWWIRLGPLLLEHPAPGVGMPARLVLVFTALSGLGALTLIRPHGGVPGRLARRAAIGAALYAPLLATLWHLLLRYDPMRPTPFSLEQPDDSDRVWLRMLASCLIVLIVLCLRSNARLLAARSLLMRLGRADRQTMIALIATVGVWLIGDLIGLATSIAPGTMDSILIMVSTIVIAVGSGLFTIGLAWIVWDTIRMTPVLIEPSPALDDVVSYPDAGDRPACLDAPNASGAANVPDGEGGR